MKLKQDRQTRASLALSIALHVLFGAVLVRVVAYPLPLDHFFVRDRESEAPAERVRFVALPAAGATTTPGRSGGDGRPRTRRPAPALRAPTAPPDRLPPASLAASNEPSGRGELIGAGGPAEGIRPSFTGPRLWSPIAPYVGAPGTPAQRLDSSLVARLRAHRDSMVAVTQAPSKSERGDWTVERDGRKYGIDKKYIHLGRFQLPTAALALLPFNQQANPITGGREARYNAMHGEIQEQAQRAMNYEEFRNAARAIRERKDRERAAARAAAVAAESNR